MFYEQMHSSTHHYFLLSQTISDDFSFPMHLHPNYEFMYVEEGVLRVGIGNVSFDVSAGEGALILPHQPHRFETPTHSRCRLIIFSSDYVPELKKITAEQNLYHPVISVNMPDFFEKLYVAQDNPLRLRSILYELAAKYCEGEKAPQLADESGDLIGKIVSYINAHYTEAITLEEMSHALGYSYRYMSGIVNRFFNQPFPTVINRYRINYACDLLLNTDKDITEIALLCGFGSVRNFNRGFKAIMGSAPRLYRKSKESVSQK